MPRELTCHKVNECNTAIKVTASEPSSGGAPSRYRIEGPENLVPGVGNVPKVFCDLRFQDGPIADGINGITHEVLLAIIKDRLEGFQKGPFKCRENALAITKIEEAAHWLNHRTQQRLARGVEGTHTV